jgi:hypothetical protein
VPPPDASPPHQLLRFVLAEWLPDVDDAGFAKMGPGYVGSIEVWRRGEAVTLWSRARLAWLAEHGWPDEGDPGTLLREAPDVRKSTVLR